jgi:hypothetical protein
MTTVETARHHSLGTTLLLIALTASVGTSVLLLTSQSFHARVYDILSMAGLEQALAQGVLARSRAPNPEIERLKGRVKVLESQLTAHDANVKRAKKISKTISTRTAKNVALNVSSIMEEAVPYIGAGVVVAVTVADVKAACDNIRDLNEMTKAFSDADSQESRSEAEVCGMKVPSAETVIDEITRNLRGAVSKSSKQAKQSAHTFYNDLGGTLHVIFDD